MPIRKQPTRRSVPKRSAADEARRRERALLRATVKTQQDIRRLLRQLASAIASGQAAMTELMYRHARDNGLRVLSRQEAERIELDRRELEELRVRAAALDAAIDRAAAAELSQGSAGGAIHVEASARDGRELGV
jgi:hypothetical protein